MKFQARISGKKMEWATPSAEADRPASDVQLAGGQPPTGSQPPTAGQPPTGWSFSPRPGGWVIATRGNERIRFHYSRVKQQFWAKISGNDFYGDRIPVTRAGAKDDGGSDFIAQFPGKVRKILVAEDQKVAEGTPLIMIEAMKMEFAVKASSAGTVKKILITENQVLTPGQKLLDFEVEKKK